MNIKHISSKFTIVLITIFHTLVWFIAFLVLSFNDPYGLYLSFPDFLTSKAGEYFATLLMLILSITILLSARLKFIEKLSHGLDKVYLLHKHLAYFSVLLLLLHNFLANKSYTTPIGFFSFAKSVDTPLLYAFLVFIFISALPHIPIVKKIFNIPYHIWKYTHYLMGVLFLVGIYHSLGVNSITFNNPTLSIYMYVVYVIGVLAFVYKLFFYNFLKKRYKYLVEEIRIIDEDNIEIFLSPKNKKMMWKAGQFALFQFLVKDMREVHPFSISDFEDNGKIRLSIKTLGDYTSQMRNTIRIGDSVLVDGPYGAFISEKENDNEEVWVAGGIGVAPFLAMVEDYKKNNNHNKKIIFVWSVVNEKDAIYNEEILKDLPSNIKYILHDVSKSGFFRFESLKNEIKNIKTTEAFVCGPEIMKNAVMDSARKIGLKHFHYEEFNFR